jgi:hypothetical protein
VLKLNDAVRIVRLLTANRYYDGTVGVRRPPEVGDLGMIVHQYDRDDPRAPFMVEKSDAGGNTLWLADFEPDELELVDTSA